MKDLEMIKEMMEMQATLDKAIYEAKGVEFDHTKCIIAIFDEIGELNHVLKPTWCWWKETVGEVNNQRVLEELVDIWHFVLSTWNHFDFDEVSKSATKLLNDCYDGSRDILEAKSMSDPMNNVHTKALTCYQWLISTDIDIMLVGLLVLSGDLGFSVEAIYTEYKRKNKVNFERLKTGY